MQKLHNLYNLRENRKQLRKNPTKQEEMLWWYLRNNRLGVKFRRQHSVGGYVLDFFCKEKRLVVEVDGGIHNTKENKEYDEVRDKLFIDLNYKILRFSNDEIENSIDMVITKIKENL